MLKARGGVCGMWPCDRSGWRPQAPGPRPEGWRLREGASRLSVATLGDPPRWRKLVQRGAAHSPNPGTLYSYPYPQVHNHRLPSGNKQFSCSRALCACEVGSVCPTMGEYHPGTPGARVRVVCRGCGAVRSHFEGRRWVHNHRLPSGNKQFSCSRALCACEEGTTCPNLGAFHPPIPYHLTCPAANGSTIYLASADCLALATSTAASTGVSAGDAAPRAPAPAHLASAAPVLSASSEPAAAPSPVPVAAAAAVTPALIGAHAPMTKAPAAPLLPTDALAAATHATPALSGLVAIASAPASDDATPAAVSSPPAHPGIDVD